MATSLRDFVSNYMDATNNKNKLEDVLALINSEAKKQAKNGVACLDEEDVEKIIDNATKLLKENKTSVKVEPKPVTKPTPKTTTNKPKATSKPIAKPKSQTKVSRRDETMPTSEFNFDQLGLF